MDDLDMELTGFDPFDLAPKSHKEWVEAADYFVWLKTAAKEAPVGKTVKIDVRLRAPSADKARLPSAPRADLRERLERALGDAERVKLFRGPVPVESPEAAPPKVSLPASIQAPEIKAKKDVAKKASVAVDLLAKGTGVLKAMENVGRPYEMGTLRRVITSALRSADAYGNKVPLKERLASMLSAEGLSNSLTRQAARAGDTSTVVSSRLLSTLRKHPETQHLVDLPRMYARDPIAAAKMVRGSLMDAALKNGLISAPAKVSPASVATAAAGGAGLAALLAGGRRKKEGSDD